MGYLGVWWRPEHYCGKVTCNIHFLCSDILKKCEHSERYIVYTLRIYTNMLKAGENVGSMLLYNSGSELMC